MSAFRWGWGRGRKRRPVPAAKYNSKRGKKRGGLTSGFISDRGEKGMGEGRSG